MLRSLKDLEGYKLDALDDTLGRVRDLLFDDEAWTVRYLVATTGPWLFGRRVLIAWPHLGEPDWSTRTFPVKLTREQVEHAPGVDLDAPVSRRHELAMHRHYGWDPYWNWSWAQKTEAEPPVLDEDIDAVHVRSLDEVASYSIRAADGEIGHAEDLIADTVTWAIHYLVADTRTWLPGRHVLVPIEAVEAVDWGERIVELDLSKEQLEDSPRFDPNAPINRTYETRLYDFYGRPTDWA